MIELYNDGSNYIMRFLNCEMPLPLTPGLHICSSGCGAGKSTVIMKIIEEFWERGVLVMVPTIKEAHEIEGKLLNFQGGLLKLGNAPQYIVIHTENEHELLDYKDRPEHLSNIDVVVVTHTRAIIDPIELFLNFKGGKRLFCLIDELINFYPSAFEIPEKIKPYVTFVDFNKTHNGKSGENIGSGIYRHIYTDTKLMKAALMKDKMKLFPSKTRLSEYKEGVILEHIAREGFTSLRNKVKDFCNDVVTILFDGTGDIIFKSSDKRLLPVKGSKYSSDIRFEQFPITIKRHSTLEWNLERVEKYCSPVIELVKGLSGKTLVVTWKTIGFLRNTSDADELERLENDMNFPKLLTAAITNAGVAPDNFTVIHRGSGQDRGSNDYRNYKNIVFYGEWNLPDNITGEINSMFGCRTNFEYYMLSLLVQTICRLAIRLHNGEAINVYYSSDMNVNMMYEVQEYFKQNSKVGCIVHGINPPLKKLSKPDKKLTVDIVFLYSLDSGIKGAMEGNLPYACNVTLDKLYSIIKRARKERGLYKGLVDFLKKRGITLNIT